MISLIVVVGTYSWQMIVVGSSIFVTFWVLVYKELILAVRLHVLWVIIVDSSIIKKK